MKRFCATVSFQIIFCCVAIAGLTALPPSSATANVKLSSLFGDHMVVQRDMPIVYWGWADAGEKVTVDFDGETAQATADDAGYWRVELAKREAGGPFQVIIKGNNSIVIKDVLVGEVWICSGQSNMAWTVQNSYDAELEKLAAKFPQIRIISVPQVGTQEPQNDFNGKWEACTPETIGDFSAVGYFFGRQLHQTLDVPIGLIDNAWGGSACEAWIRNDILAADDQYKPLLDSWVQRVANAPESKKKHDKMMGGLEREICRRQDCR